MKESHINIPFFIPFAGCKHKCIFCAQEKITGVSVSDADIESELFSLHETLTRANLPFSREKNPKNVQLAFFGGSFTGIESERMDALLAAGESYIRDGLIQSIRISTRPDLIDSAILKKLKQHGVSDIELGIQSMDETVLRKSGRGHTAEQTRSAARLIVDSGLHLTGQMMIGLPGASADSELFTASEIKRLGASAARIYPLVVFEKTALHELVMDGSFTPISTKEAVKRSADCFLFFLNNNIDVIRVGLHEVQNAVGGANHPAFGELVRGAVYKRIIEEKLEKYIKKGGTGLAGYDMEIFVRDKDISNLTANKGELLRRLKDKYAIKNIRVTKNNSDPFSPQIFIGDTLCD